MDVAAGAGSEIIAVTNVSGTTWTVTRGAEGTTPVAHTTGFTIRQVVTSGWLSTVPAENSASIQYVSTSGDATGVTDTAAIQAALNAVPSGGIVQLAAGYYYTNVPLIIPPASPCKAPHTRTCGPTSTAPPADPWPSSRRSCPSPRSPVTP